MIKWTEEELEEMREADRQIEAGFIMTQEERMLSSELDSTAITENLSSEQRKKFARSKRYREKHPEIISERKKEYAKANEAKIAQQKKLYRSLHKDEIAEYKKAYRLEHKDEIAEKSKEYYRSHCEKIKSKRMARYYRQKAEGFSPDARYKAVESSLRWRDKHHEEYIAYQREYRQRKKIERMELT